MESSLLRGGHIVALTLGLAVGAAGQQATSSPTWDERLLDAERKYDSGEYLPFLAQMEGLVREAERFGADDYRRAIALHVMGVAYYELGRLLESARCLERAAKFMASHPKVPGLSEARTLNLLATTYVDLGQYARAEKVLQQTREMMRPAAAEAWADLARTDLVSAKLLLLRGRPRDSETLIRAALARKPSGDKLELEELVFLWNLLGIIQVQAGRWGEADDAYRHSMEIGCAIWGDRHVNTLRTRLNLAGVRREMGRLEEAELMAREVQESLETQLGPDHPAVGTALIERAETLRAMKRGKESRQLKRRAERILASYESMNRLGSTVDIGALSAFGAK
jgi:tetratricopeptide (TPR) repeat protein